MSNFTTVVDKSVGDVFTEAMWDTYIKDNLNKGVNRPIADFILAGSAASFDFTSIDQNFAHLRLVLFVRSDRAGQNQDNVAVRVNNDSGGDYYSEQLGATAAVASSFEALAASKAFLGLCPAALAAANYYSAHDIIIPYYTVAKAHPFQSLSTSWYNTGTGTGTVQFYGNNWSLAQAINRLTVLSDNSANFVAGSRATLYGLAF